MISRAALWAARSLALLALFVGALVLYDLFLGQSVLDEGQVLEKRGGRNLTLIVQGKQAYSEGVPRRFFEKIQTGDKIKLELTPLFKEWRKVVAAAGPEPPEARGTDIFPMTVIGFAFLFPMAAFFPIVCAWAAATRHGLFLLLTIGTIELVAVLLFCKLLLYWCGFVEKL